MSLCPPPSPAPVSRRQHELWFVELKALMLSALVNAAGLWALAAVVVWGLSQRGAGYASRTALMVDGSSTIICHEGASACPAGSASPQSAWHRVNSGNSVSSHDSMDEDLTAVQLPSTISSLGSMSPSFTVSSTFKRQDTPTTYTPAALTEDAALHARTGAAAVQGGHMEEDAREKAAKASKVGACRHLHHGFGGLTYARMWTCASARVGKILVHRALGDPVNVDWMF